MRSGAAMTMLTVALGYIDVAKVLLFEGATQSSMTRHSTWTVAGANPRSLKRRPGFSSHI